MNRVVITALNRVNIHNLNYLLNKYPLNKNIEKRMTTASKLAYVAVKDIFPDEIPKNTGLIIGSTFPYNIINLDKGFNTSDIFTSMSCCPAINIAEALNIQDMVIPISSACSTSLQALAVGYMAIATGQCEHCIVGGCDVVTPKMEAVFKKLRILSNKCRPFNVNRNGTILKSAASIFILSKLNEINKKDNLGEIIGIGMSKSIGLAVSNTYSIVDCMTKAYTNAFDNTKDIIIDYLVTHATGTYSGDGNEAEAIALSKIPFKTIIAWKEIFGHTLAASGLYELGETIISIKQNIHIPDIRMDKDIILHQMYLPKESNTSYIMSNNFGLGGINTSAIIKIN